VLEPAVPGVALGDPVLERQRGERSRRRVSNARRIRGLASARWRAGTAVTLDNYLDYLRLKLRRATEQRGTSADVQKKALSDDR